MVAIRWTEPALADIDGVASFLNELSPLAAERVLGRIAASVRQLALFPLSGREGRSLNTRELVVPRSDYILAYRIVEDRIDILAVVHGNRDWPEHFRNIGP